MKTVNIAELKNRLSVYLSEVKGGEADPGARSQPPLPGSCTG